MRFSAGCLLGTLLGLVLAAAAFFAFTLFNSSSVLPLVPAASPGASDLQITIGEAYLNQQIQAGLAQRGMDLGDIAVNLHAPNRADVSLGLNVRVLNQSFAIRPTAAYHFGVSNGSVVLTLDGVDVGGLQVPQQLVNQQVGNLQRLAQEEINAELKRMLANTGLHVTSVEASEGELIVKLAR